MTGFTVIYPELSAKRLELLKEMIPGLSRVAVIWDPSAMPAWYSTPDRKDQVYLIGGGGDGAHEYRSR